MAYVVAEPCVRCKYTDCVDVCPVDCFHEGPNFLVIDPNVCIDCALCVDECPAGAIFSVEALPEKYERYIELNVALSKSWPVLSESKEPLDDADEWVEVEEKFDELLME